MFFVCASFISLLQSVIRSVSFISVAYVREICEDGSLCEGVEVNIPFPALHNRGFSAIFWGCHAKDCLPSMECAALQVVVFLQGIYGFIVVDYNYGGLVRSQSLCTSAVEVAAVRVCRHIVDQAL